MESRKQTISLAVILIITLLSAAVNPLLVQASPVDAPQLVISSQYKMPVFKAGDEVRLAIPVRNEGLQDALDIHASLNVSTDPSIYPFEIQTLVPKVRSSMIHAGFSDDIALRLKVSPKAESKIYPLSLLLEYRSLSGSTYSSTETIYVKVENNIETPKVTLHKSTVANNRLLAGETGRITIDLFNDSQQKAKDIKVRLGGFSQSTIFLQGLNRDQKTLAELSPKHFNDSLFFDVTVDSNLSSGVYSLDVFIEYKDPLDRTYKEQAIIYIPVEKHYETASSADLRLESITFPTEKIAVNEPFSVSFKLHNRSQEQADNVKISINGGNDLLPKSMPIHTLHTLQAGASKDFNFTLFAREQAETKNYPIQILVEYQTSARNSSQNQTQHSFSQYVGVLIEGKEQEDDDEEKERMTPKLILENYYMNETYVQAGSDFNLTVSLLNTHFQESIKNITVNFSSDGDTFSPVNTSNTFYIQNIDANNTTQRTLTLRPAVDAAFKTHNLHLDIQYEDSDGNSYSTREVIGIPVMQEVRLIVGEIELPPTASIGSPIPVSTDFYNAGRAPIRNLIIRLEGNFETRDRSIYIGNVEPGKNSYYDATVNPIGAGELTGKVIFEFLDPIDQKYVIEREFSVQLEEWQDPYMGPGGMYPDIDFDYQPSQSNTKLYYYIGGGLLFLLIAGLFIYKRRKRKRELEEVDFHA
ncbi:COG1361 S-layer family protein [Desulfuribacillus alkaliarsenatis]|uniref:CARDB domain-containing protein n=1 Tax=Desulfuribacillus alkaliarsenatis TaxID=766136 RepID=A0A1E5G1P5_9FIRM|nr:hypothetical protein [Desulfuribacillus alkaliarsenatis]OEF96839.1 hypothetical protein BHF68_07200 [Desulfuribacillus alkaliarsenatis]